MAQTNLVGQTILGYTVKEKINEGTFGTVYKVVKNNPSGQYIRALKHIQIPSERQYMSVLNSMGGNVAKADNYFSEMLQEIISEIKILNDLSEKGVRHIVRYYENDIQVIDNPKHYDIYILMEYLTPLEEYIKDNEFLINDVMMLAFDILDGLKSCHENGVIHRDIKDDNIFVSENGGYKIGDFGVSKVLKDSTRAESLKGTPNFLAPEVYLGKEGYTMSVDLYSLGIVLYRLLNYGRNPFLPAFPAQYYAQDEDLAFEKRMKGEIPDLPLLGGDKIGNVIVKAISGDTERYQSAEEFIMDLKAAVESTDMSILQQNIKMDLNFQNAPVEELSDFGETIGEYVDFPADDEQSTLEEDTGSTINKHLFDTIGEERIDDKEPESIPELEVTFDRKKISKEPRSVADPENRVVKKAPVVRETVVTESQDKNIKRIISFVLPIIFVIIALFVFVFGGNIWSFMLHPIFWFGWIVIFIASLFFLGKQLQNKPVSHSVNAILVGQEPYILAMDISSLLKEICMENKSRELNLLKDKFKRIEERMAVESHFGSGTEQVIKCENDIACQLQYLSESVPNVLYGDMERNISELNKSMENIESLLSKRTVLKRK